MTRPVTGILYRRWRSRTADVVIAPKMPSTIAPLGLPNLTPAAPKKDIIGWFTHSCYYIAPN
ncbi:hypothetical protein [Scytonema sp. NUACC21]